MKRARMRLPVFAIFEVRPGCGFVVIYGRQLGGCENKGKFEDQSDEIRDRRVIVGFRFADGPCLSGSLAVI